MRASDGDLSVSGAFHRVGNLDLSTRHLANLVDLCTLAANDAADELGGGKQITRTRDDIHDLHLLLHDLHRLEWSARESQSAQRRPSQLRGTREATVNVWTMAELNHICIICPPTLEALVAMCNWKGALLHGQLVKFGELLKCGRKGHKDNYDEGGKKCQLEFCKYFPCKIDDERKKMRWGMKK